MLSSRAYLPQTTPPLPLHLDNLFLTKSNFLLIIPSMVTPPYPPTLHGWYLLNHCQGYRTSSKTPHPSNSDKADPTSHPPVFTLFVLSHLPDRGSLFSLNPTHPCLQAWPSPWPWTPSSGWGWRPLASCFLLHNVSQYKPLNISYPPDEVGDTLLTLLLLHAFVSLYQVPLHLPLGHDSW